MKCVSNRWNSKISAGACKPDEQTSSRFRMQHINDFYYGWSATAADINHDGILDIVSGPFYYLGPDYQSVSRNLFQQDSPTSARS